MLSSQNLRIKENVAEDGEIRLALIVDTTVLHEVHLITERSDRHFSFVVLFCDLLQQNGNDTFACLQLL